MVTLISVPLGWVGWELDQRRREQKVVNWIEQMGGEVYFHSGNRTSLFSGLLCDERSWWEKTTDMCFGKSVYIVAFGYPGYKDTSDLSPLAELMNLERLYLKNTHVSDLSPLAELKNLEVLDLNGTLVSDLWPLAELKSLGSLDLTNTKVSEEQVQELRLALPNCKIDF